MPISSHDFFGNVLRSYVADEQRKWVKVGRSKNREEWEMVPAEVNAYFCEFSRIFGERMGRG